MPSKKKKTKKQKKPKLKKSKLKKSKTVATKRTSSRAKKARPQKKAAGKKQSKKKASSTTTGVRGSKTPSRRPRRLDFTGRRDGAVPVPQSEDFQGLSRAEDVDSESVDELVEEGNPFEAGAVAGVEEADNSDEKEVRTHEVSEDDVPEEYLDKDE